MPFTALLSLSSLLLLLWWCLVSSISETVSVVTATATATATVGSSSRGSTKTSSHTRRRRYLHQHHDRINLQDDINKQNNNELFWKHYDGQIEIDYGPNGHPFEQKRKQRQLIAEQRQQHDQNKDLSKINTNDNNNVPVAVMKSSSSSSSSSSTIITTTKDDTDSEVDSDQRELNTATTVVDTSSTNLTLGANHTTVLNNNVKYTPIRIGLVTDPIEQYRNNTVYANIGTTIDYILDTVLTDAVKTWSNHLSVYPVNEIIEIYPDECLGRFLDSGLQYQTFNNTDLVLIVDASLVSRECSLSAESALAYASVCVTDQYGRPVIGYIHFCLAVIAFLTETTTTATTTNSTTSTSSESLSSSSSSGTNNDSSTTTATGTMTGFQQNDTSSGVPTFLDVVQENYATFTNQTFDTSETTISLLSVVIHEIAHALGIASPLFLYFTDIDTGIPFTTIDTVTGTIPVIEKLCSNGTTSFGQYPDDNIIQTQLNPVNGLLFQYLVTPRVRQVTQNFFNCTSIIGARLEDSDMYCIGSHFHERHLYTELMSPSISGIGENVLSPFTLALLEDSGFYQVDYIGSQLPSFGINAGCDFLFKDCILNEQVPEYVVSEFCSSPLLLTSVSTIAPVSLAENLYCDPSLESWALCNLFAMRDDANIPPVNRDYFTSTDDTISYRPDGTNADSCPIPSVAIGLDCTKPDTTYNPFYPGEQVGTASRCFNAFYNDSYTGQYIRQPACAQVICDMSTLSVIVQIGSSSSSSSSSSVVCEYNEQIIMIPDTTNGYIICPRREALCPQFFTCPYACSGRGVCVRNTDTTGNGPPMKCICTDPTNTDPACASPAVVAARGPTPTVWSTPVATTTTTAMPVATTPVNTPPSAVAFDSPQSPIILSPSLPTLVPIGNTQSSLFPSAPISASGTMSGPISLTLSSSSPVVNANQSIPTSSSSIVTTSLLNPLLLSIYVSIISLYFMT